MQGVDKGGGAQRHFSRAGTCPPRSRAGGGRKVRRKLTQTPLITFPISHDPSEGTKTIEKRGLRAKKLHFDELKALQPATERECHDIIITAINTF